jgi:hypothetical protein
VYVSEPEAGFLQSFELRTDRQVYFICIEGRIEVNGVWLSARDAARITTTSATSTTMRIVAGDIGAHM